MRGLYAGAIIYLFVNVISAGPIAHDRPRSGPVKSYNDSTWSSQLPASALVSLPTATGRPAQANTIAADSVIESVSVALGIPRTTNTTTRALGEVRSHGTGARIHSLYATLASERAPVADYSTPVGDGTTANSLIRPFSSAPLVTTTEATPLNKRNPGNGALPSRDFALSSRPPAPIRRSSLWRMVYRNCTSTNSQPLATVASPVIVLVTEGPSSATPVSAGLAVTTVHDVSTKTVRVTVYVSPTAAQSDTSVLTTRAVGHVTPLPTSSSSPPSTARSSSGVSVIPVTPTMPFSPTGLSVIPKTPPSLCQTQTS